MATLEDTTEESWDRTHATNLRGAYLAIRAARPRMRERGGGSIIITSSLLGIVGNPDLPAYGAAKGGLRAMCRSFAAMCGPEGIRINTICPGDVDTELLQDYFDFQPDPRTRGVRSRSATRSGASQRRSMSPTSPSFSRPTTART